jgi:MFS family permease
LAEVVPVGSNGLSDDDLNAGLRLLLYDGMCSQVMLILTTGTFLVAFALLLGASNRTIGLIAAIGPLAQILQIPSIYLIRRLGRRRAVTFLTAFVGRAAWLVVAALPWFAPSNARVPLLLLALGVYFGLGAVTGCAFNSWIRDLIPERIMGGFFAKRMALATAVGAVLSLVAGAAVDVYARFFQEAMGIYSILFVIGGVAGLAGAIVIGRIPEPAMRPEASQGLFSVLYEPLKDSNYRRLIVFLGSWNFAVAFAAPFFVVYMLKDLGLTMTWVIGLSVVSQGFNVLFFRLWGRLADRFTNKSVLTVSGPLFIVSFLIWPFLTLPERHFLTIPLLVLIHVLGGVSSAGVALCAGNLALRSAPYGRATAFLAVNALVSGLAATIAPLIAGVTADWFATKQLSLTIRWGNVGAEAGDLVLPALDLQSLEFIFVIAFVLGMYSIHRLLAVREEGEVEERIVIQELYAEVRKLAQHVSNIPGIRQLTNFPYAVLRRPQATGGPTKE